MIVIYRIAARPVGTAGPFLPRDREVFTDPALAMIALQRRTEIHEALHSKVSGYPAFEFRIEAAEPEWAAL